MYKILIVEDDAIIRKTMKEALQNWGHAVIDTENFKDVLSVFMEADPQLVLLDIALPFYSGYYWCSEIRKCSKVPIIFVSSSSDDMNMVMAMNMGADDFVSKPFNLDLFIAKVNALLRRTYDYVGQTSVLAYSGALLHLGDATLCYRDVRLDLTKNEFRILQMLMETPENIFSRSAIMTRLWDDDSFIDDNTLTVNINRLRKKLEEIGLEHWIVTKKGIGYVLEERIDL